MDVHVEGQGAVHHAGEAADAEQEDEGEREEQGRLEVDAALVEGAHPVEDLDGAGYGHDHGEQREQHQGEAAHAAGEHVVGPHQAAHASDGHGAEGNGLVAKDRPLGEGGDDLGDDPHGRQDHDVDRRVRVDPEQVLVEHGVAALGRIEDADAEEALEDDQHQGDGHDGGRQDLDPGGGVEGPAHEGHAEPLHAWRPEAVDGGDEVDAREHGRKAQHERCKHRQAHIGAGAEAVGCVEGPARIRSAAAREEGQHSEDGAGHEEVPGGQVQARKGDVLGPDQDGQEEIPKDRRQARNHEEEDHDHAVKREHGVVGLSRDQVLEGGQLHQAHDHADGDAHEEKHHHGIEVHQRNALVVRGGQPGHDTRAHPGVHQVAGLCGGCVGGAHALSSSSLALRPFTSTSRKIAAIRMITMAPMAVVLRTYRRPAGS